VRRLTSRAAGNAASSMFAAMAMVEGPWFTGRSATPSRRAASASKWMGLGSASNRASVFIRAGST